jgi:hypothetical protein
LKPLLFLVLLFPVAALADLYRWVDRETGSVRLSNYPPGASASQVEVIRYVPPGAPRPPQEPAKPAPKPSSLAALETQWRTLKQALETLPSQADFSRAGGGFAQQADAYRAVRAELDRVDPAGAARRRAEDQTLMQRLGTGLRTLVDPGTPVRQ